MPELKPLFARVLLEREKATKVGSILIPDSAAKRHASLKCRVIAKGPSADESVRIGSLVIIGMHAGAWLNAEGKAVSQPEDAEFYIVMDEDIICEVVE